MTLADPALPVTADVAILAHGAGSTGEFAVRALPGRALGVREVVGLDHRSGDIDAIAGRLRRLVRVHVARGRRVLLGGISIGAHAAARCAIGHPDPGLVGLVLALPAWTGAPDVVAAATGAAADEIAAAGVSGVLARLRSDPALRGDWVVSELARAWPAYGDSRLLAALRAAAVSPAPTLTELAGITVPTTVIALADDPLHPESVARAWTEAIPGARLIVHPRRQPPPFLPPHEAPAPR